jgi:hypothetical protein
MSPLLIAMIAANAIPEIYTSHKNGAPLASSILRGIGAGAMGAIGGTEMSIGKSLALSAGANLISKAGDKLDSGKKRKSSEPSGVSSIVQAVLEDTKKKQKKAQEKSKMEKLLELAEEAKKKRNTSFASILDRSGYQSRVNPLLQSLMMGTFTRHGRME